MANFGIDPSEFIDDGDFSTLCTVGANTFYGLFFKSHEEEFEFSGEVVSLLAVTSDLTTASVANGTSIVITGEATYLVKDMLATGTGHTTMVLEEQ